MPQLGGLDSCVAPSIILAQRVKEPLHLPFDFRCIGVHAALLPVWLQAEGLITYFGKTGKLFPAHSLGAGEYAHILSLGKERFHENTLINVLALPVGIRLAKRLDQHEAQLLGKPADKGIVDDNTFQVLVEPNSTVPHTSRPYAVTTPADNQTLIHVEVLQGPRGATRADQCVVLDSIDMDVPPAPAGTFKFEVSFDVKSDGTMTVVVTDVHQKRTARKEIDETKLTWIGERRPDGAGPGSM